MKQGRASRDVTESRKVEPRAHAVGKAYGGQLGSHYGNHADEGDTRRTAAVTMYEGRGYEAPKAGRTIHHGGSQGKHR
jgi:hypothetical protein